MSGSQSKKTPFSGTQESLTQSRRGTSFGKSKSGASGRTQGGRINSTQGSGNQQKKMLAPSGSPMDKPSASRFPIKVFDDSGVDVTPLPILSNQIRIQSLGDTTVSTPTDILSQLSTGTGSVFGGGPFSRSVFTPSFDTAGLESVVDEEAHGMGVLTEIQQVRLEVREVLTEEDLNKEIVITLEETGTFWFLNTPTVCVSAESEEAENVALDNGIYAKLCKSRAGNDLYAEREMNTFNEAGKFKLIQTDPIIYDDIGVECTYFDMYDTYAAEETTKKGADKDEEEEELDGTKTLEVLVVRTHQKRLSTKDQPSAPLEAKQSSGSSRAKHCKGSDTLSSQADSILFPSYETTITVTSENSVLNEGKILKSDALKEDLFFMERATNLNTYQTKQAIYRGFDIIAGMGSQEKLMQINVDDIGPNLDRLWSYSCNLTRGHNVACMAWNKTNPDLLAVGYGQFEFTTQKSGLICCWCLKNPEYPERIYQCKSGVTALDFSDAHPNILAAGYYDGRVALYNVRSMASEPLLDSHDTHNKHLGPVWQLQWIEKEKGAGEERAEVLISISTDGHVMQWSVRNGFECYDIMRLKKVGTRMSHSNKGKEKRDETIISRYAGGLCFDFDVRDDNAYLAGTEEGYIHKCSCSYNEQYLETYSGHTGPVYRVRWSPFVPDLFLSCSADWSLCLWHQEHTTPLLTFHSSTKQVPDLCWSPRSSTVFACVNEGCVEVWDLSQSILDPVITLTPTYAVKLASITFCKNADCILVGDSDGQVTVYELRCMPPYPAMEDQAKKLSRVLRGSPANQLLNLVEPEESASEKRGEDKDQVKEQVKVKDQDQVKGKDQVKDKEQESPAGESPQEHPKHESTPQQQES